jgi:hypothetical protein
MEDAIKGSSIATMETINQALGVLGPFLGGLIALWAGPGWLLLTSGLFFLAALYPLQWMRDADRNQVQSGATKVQFSLASTGTNKTLKFKIKALGSTPNGCVPAASVTVTATQTNYELALTDANFKLPDFCAGATVTNPALAGTLANIGAIEVSDEALPATGSATVGIHVGSIAFAPKPATPAPSTRSEPALGAPRSRRITRSGGTCDSCSTGGRPKPISKVKPTPTPNSAGQPVAAGMLAFTRPASRYTKT